MSRTLFSISVKSLRSFSSASAASTAFSACWLNRVKKTPFFGISESRGIAASFGHKKTAPPARSHRSPRVRRSSFARTLTQAAAVACEPMPPVTPWLPFAVAALLVWSVQRVVTKIALTRWSTAYFYRLNAILSLVVYVPFALVVPPDPTGLPGAFALSLLMAATFWVTTEATRRGPVGLVSPFTAMSPAVTVAPAVGLLGERPGASALAGVVLALGGAVLLAYRPTASGAASGWLGLAVASLVMQGVGAFAAKLVVTGHGPTDLLVVGALTQLVVGAVIARDEPLAASRLLRGGELVIAVTLVAAAAATIGYLTALSLGPASVIVPLVATSPALGGLLGIILLREAWTRRQLLGIACGVVAAALLATA